MFVFKRYNQFDRTRAVFEKRFYSCFRKLLLYSDDNAENNALT